MNTSAKSDWEKEMRQQFQLPEIEPLVQFVRQSRLQDQQELEWRVIGLAPYDEKNDENLISRKDVIALLKD